MEKYVTVITLPDAIKNNQIRCEKDKWRKIAVTGRHKNHYLILQYSDNYPLKPLYPPDIRASVDGIWVITQKVEDLPRNVYDLCTTRIACA